LAFKEFEGGIGFNLTFEDVGYYFGDLRPVGNLITRFSLSP